MFIVAACCCVCSLFPLLAVARSCDALLLSVVLCCCLLFSPVLFADGVVGRCRVIVCCKLARNRCCMVFACLCLWVVVGCLLFDVCRLLLMFCVVCCHVRVVGLLVYVVLLRAVA